MPRPIVVRLLAAAAFAAALAAASTAQAQVRVELGAVAPSPQPQAAVSEDGGVNVDLDENPNLDRYLRRANQCIERGDFAAAIQLLQDVVEGRSEEAVTGVAPADAAPPAANPPATAPDAPKKPAAPSASPSADPRHAVFSKDGRLYRPVRRLCHELLARLPDEGLGLYRATYEVAAAEQLQQALADGGTSALEQVQNRYFTTLAGGRALLLLGDQLMQEGRHRAAMLAFRDLLDVYPTTLRAELGVKPEWLRFKAAVCMQLAGEAAAARRELDALAAAAPEATLRVEGELQAVRDLPADARFADAAAGPERPKPGPAPVGGDAAPALSAASLADGLVPLWQYRFRNPEPYKDPKADKERTVFVDGASPAMMPFASRYGPSTRVALASDADGLPRAAFCEHFRLRVADATTGVLFAATDAVDEPPVQRELQPRVRIAASDFALLRPVDDGERSYVVIGHKRAGSNSLDVLRASELVAYHRAGLQRAWSSEQWLDGDAGLRDVTFLAAPTVFGERLLLPSLRRGRYALECLDRRTGKPLWHTLLHGGGSPFYKAPGCPVVVRGGAALVATNAGCLASVDALTGELRWLRRYERLDPLRKSAKARKATSRDELGFMGRFGSIREQELGGFHPNDLVAHDAVVVLAPVDGDLLLGVDVATGEPAWMFDAATRYASFGRLRTLVGVIGEDLYALSDTHLVAIGVAGGLVRWARELPAFPGPKTEGRGRGAVAGDCVLVPNGREVLLFGADGGPRGRLPLPAFGQSREPFGGAAQLTVHGAWLAVGYQGGVEVFSTPSALRGLAAVTPEPRRKADLLARVGEVDEAIALLAAALAAAEPDARAGLGGDLLRLVAARARGQADAGDLAGAMALLDAQRDRLLDRPLRLQWHLARLELCKASGDTVAYEREQSRLYDYMEGKG